MPCAIPLVLRAAIGGVVAIFSCKVLLKYGADVIPAAQGQHWYWCGTSHSSCHHHTGEVDQSGLVTESVRLEACCHYICQFVSSANPQAQPLSLSEQFVWLTHHVANAHPCDRRA